MKKDYFCSKCGTWTGKKRYLCSNCSSQGKEIFEAEESSFLLTNEIAEGNLSIRLREGFRLLSEID